MVVRISDWAPQSGDVVDLKFDMGRQAPALVPARVLQQRRDLADDMYEVELLPWYTLLSRWFRYRLAGLRGWIHGAA